MIKKHREYIASKTAGEKCPKCSIFESVIVLIDMLLSIQMFII